MAGAKRSSKHRRKLHSHVSMDYYAYLSGMKEWNASYKAAFSVLSLIMVITADYVPLSLMTIVFMGCLTVGAGKIRLYHYFRLMLLPVAFIMVGGAAILIQFGEGRDSILGIPFFFTRLYITKESLGQSLGLGCKAFGAVSCLYMLTLSTPVGEIISVLRRMHVPDLILELMHLIYRYIFILLQTNAMQKDAARSRLGYLDHKTALFTFGKELANLLILSMRRAQTYYDALEARGYEGNCLFWEENRKMKASHAVWGMAYLALALMVMFFL